MSDETTQRKAAEEAVAAHYGLLLGIGSPWRVRKADLNVLARKVEIVVEHEAEEAVACPECGAKCARHDHAPERTWRHLDVMQFTTLIRAKVPRASCPTHGVGTVRAPWAEPGSRFTLLFEAFAVQVIQASRSLSQAAELLRMEWDGVQRILDRSVERGLLRRSTDGVRYVGLDEKSFGRGQDYVSLMTDLKGQRVLEVVAGRDTEQAVALWESLPGPQRDKIEAAAMDMGADFAAATRKAAPRAQIVHDKFHVSKLLNDAVDKVRKEEHRRLLAEGDDSLKNTKFLWLQGALPEGERALRFEELCARDLKTARAWFHKETFLEFWRQPDAVTGLSFFNRWFQAARRSKLDPLKRTATTLKQHLAGLLNYFVHPITNALTEGFNSRIQAIKADARGFRRFANYRTRILFFCGKLDVAPRVPSALTH
jgi:transposase